LSCCFTKFTVQLKLGGQTDGTLSGQIEFDRDGIRKNFLVTVIDLTSSANAAFNKKEVPIFTE
jgi:hypothetical protein